MSSELLGALHCYINVKIESFPFSPYLAHITLCFQDRECCTIDVLCNATKDGLLPSLSHLTFIECEITSSGILSQTRWRKLTHLDLFRCNVIEGDLATLFVICNQSKQVFPRLASLGLSFGKDDTQKLLLNRFVKFPWHMLTELFVDLADEEQLSIVSLLVRKVSKMVSLGISLEETGKKVNMKQVPLKTLGHLQYLSLRRCLASDADASVLSNELKQSHICKLDLSRTPALSGNLADLFANPFPFMETLILRKCRLDQNDLQMLAVAYRKHKIPRIKHLDISDNFIDSEYHGFINLFGNACRSTWNQLQSLNIRGTL